MKTGHDTETPQALIEFMSSGWLERPMSANIQTQMSLLKHRRQQLSARFTGQRLLVAAGREQVRANDTNFRFRPSSDFAYLMGTGEPGAVLVFEPHGETHRCTLFTQPHNRGEEAFFTDRVHGELWVGRHRGVDESALFYGVDDARPISELATFLENGPQLADENELGVVLAEQRLIKDTYEIDELRTAVEITKRGFEDAIRLLGHAKSEREIEAAFWSRARIEGNDVGYLTIAAAGNHACTLHWNHNHGQLMPGELLLLDAGVECDSLYTADVTRTLPISGRFSGEQRAIYDLVWEAQRVGIDAVRPGNDFLEPNRRAMRVLTEGLVDLKILRCSIDEALDPEHQYFKRYTLHNVSHMLGIDVHDCARARQEHYKFGTLKTGMALTVEPGLYFQPDDATVPERFRGIGVRIEDDIIVTNDVPNNLSAILPSRADDVEAWYSSLHA